MERSQVASNELQAKERHLEDLSRTFEALDEKIYQLQQENNSLVEENLRLQQQLQTKNKESERVRAKMEQIEACIDDIYLDKQSKGASLLEIEYLKSDIERLVALLRNTKEVFILCILCEKNILAF